MINIKNSSIIRLEELKDEVAKAVEDERVITVLVIITRHPTANPVYGVYTSPDMTLGGGKLVHYSHSY